MLLFDPQCGVNCGVMKHPKSARKALSRLHLGDTYAYPFLLVLYEASSFDFIVWRTTFTIFIHIFTSTCGQVEDSEQGYIRTVGWTVSLHFWNRTAAQFDKGKGWVYSAKTHVLLICYTVRNSHTLQSGTAISLELGECAGLNGHDYPSLYLNGWEKLSAWEFQETA